MVMNIISIIALALIGTVMCKLMDKYNKIYSLLIAVGVICVVLLIIFSYISPIMGTINSLISRSGLKFEYSEILFKSLGICYVTQFAYDVCKDNNENAIATQVEIAGKVALLILALPLFESIVDIVTKLISL